MLPGAPGAGDRARASWLVAAVDDAEGAAEEGAAAIDAAGEGDASVARAPGPDEPAQPAESRASAARQA